MRMGTNRCGQLLFACIFTPNINKLVQPLKIRIKLLNVYFISCNRLTIRILSPVTKLLHL